MNKIIRLFCISSVFLLLNCGVKAQPLFLTNGLVAYYPLNGNANDASGNGINGTITNDVVPTTDQLGNPNGAMYFGTNGGGIFGTNLNLENSSSSISLWINKNYVGNLFNGGWILHVGDVGDNGKVINIATDYGQSIRFSFWNDDFDINSPVLAAHRWYSLTVTFDNTTLQRSIYVDGCLVATNTAAYGFIGDSFFEFGQENISMDDIRFYNRALSSTEVQQLFVYESPPLIGLIKSVKPAFFNLALGTNYQLQVSGDLNTWTNQGAAFTATNSSMVYPQYFDVNNWNQLFFRLQVNP